jgi:hypothetical protein
VQLLIVHNKHRFLGKKSQHSSPLFAGLDGKCSFAVCNARILLNLVRLAAVLSLFAFPK